ncbi:hypothetical protein BV25DRAFT_1901587 [Artomyces pyxidatus]|uniref:Uncharacterized protein n=1 Tax=Artomyces pyxidatus TaxID=48021 RepID=A0ACB8SS71_9AGAM|nr:hypothetical protein BV25DRAFT_1901587 [Artomyces pyxidatus]
MPAGAQPTHHVHPGDLPYSTPVLRSASPSESVTTDYGPDQTTPADAALSPEEFERKIESQLRLNFQRDAELRAEAQPLIMPRKPGEEKLMFEHVMRSLRWHTQQLEENEIIETAILRSSQVEHGAQTSTSDVDEIMQSMMGPPLTSVPTSPMSVDDASAHGASRYPQSTYSGGTLFGSNGYGKGKGRVR